MRILIYSYNYYPEPIGIAPLITELAEGLVKKGHEVRVVTGMPWYPQREIYEGYRGKLFFTENIKGVTIQRSYLRICPRPSLIDRILMEVSFVATSFFIALLGKRPDVLLLTVPGLPVSVPAVLLGWLYRCPIVLNLQDILPDAAVKTGILKNKLMIRVFEQLEKFAYRYATKISVIAEGFIDNLRQKGIAEAKMELIPNWVDVHFICPLPKENNEFRKTHHLQDKFVVMYSGNIARTQGIETVINAAVRLRGVEDIAIVIVGEEKALEQLQRYEEKTLEELLRYEEKALEELQLEEGKALEKLRLYKDTCKATNVILLPFQPREKLPEMLAAADVGLVVQKSAVISFNMPSKIPVLLSSGRPILGSVPANGTAARAIQKSGGGIVVPPEDAGELVAAILDLYHNREKVKMLGEKSRQYALANYSREQALDRYQELFNDVMPLGGELTTQDS
ncbi:MAG: glycosyltransferase family 4 protein [Symploca sp. SIO2B6]|nr:glycosyltransferase family 4 protein [Symploca sp. SIO2B6]